MSFTPIDWMDAIDQAAARGFNTLGSGAAQISNWGHGWPNTTAFATASESNKEVDLDRMNLAMWAEWDDMLRYAADRGIYLWAGGFSGKYGGRDGKYPPADLAYLPKLRERATTAANKIRMRYQVARQGAFWNIAFWGLGGTEVYAYDVADKGEFDEYIEYLASITPWNRMITAQDCEQWHDRDRRWLSSATIPTSRKFNTVQTAVASSEFPHWGSSNKDNAAWQEARPNYELALDSYGGFPVMGTETLWEGQGRANKPLRIIWGFFAAGAHTFWNDWRYENSDHTVGSLGRGWVPVKPLDQHVLAGLGDNCSGDEQILIATEALEQLEYWKMSPHRELVSSGAEAYCLAEPGRQYMVYAPGGGNVKLDLSGASGTFRVRWLDPRKGGYSHETEIHGGAVQTLQAPSGEDWVAFVLRK
jgi:hypothetical protein